MRKQLGQKAFLVFLIGLTKTEDEGKALLTESLQEKDILQANLKESHKILPYKVAMGFIWVRR